ncbi:DUF2141 domain-containing protein [Roseateles paludis]|uniref:DUF2141 domain-containing protein n=1 Tax=Roseateles paludis TaxID=3145238 RepID=A0ABV0G2W4_9BURK
MLGKWRRARNDPHALPHGRWQAGIVGAILEGSDDKGRAAARHGVRHGVRSRVCFLGAMVGLAALCPALAADLTLKVDGVAQAQGQIVARLFVPGDALDGPARAVVSAPAVAGTVTLVFQGIAAGRYAYFVFHDLNGNGVLDHNLIRWPTEPLGFSAGFKLGLLSGKPDSYKLAFSLTEADAEQRVELQ